MLTTTCNPLEMLSFITSCVYYDVIGFDELTILITYGSRRIKKIEIPYDYLYLVNVELDRCLKLYAGISSTCVIPLLFSMHWLLSCL